MGLFDRVRKANIQQTQIALGPAESFAAIALVVVAADGYLADAEVNLLTAVLSRMQLFRSYPNDVMRRMFDNLCNQLQRHGAQVLIEAAIKTLPHELYDTTFAVATDLVLADGQVTPEEENLLTSLCQALEIPESTAQEIINVMVIKNKG